MATYQTYAMAGIKEDFADWVSNISPEYTPLISMIRKFPVHNTMFQWQWDKLSDMKTNNAYAEASDADSVELTPTTVVQNYTQIMRKVVFVSDSANAVSSHGREKELFYQLKKAAKELKRDNEGIFLLAAQEGKAGAAGTPRLTSSFGQMIDASMKKTGELKEELLFETTALLYTEGADPTLIMYHPSKAEFFASLQEKSGTRMRIFENDKRFVKQVEYIVDPLGQELKCIPNRWMPQDVIYIFNPSDLGMAVLRAPKKVALAKSGSAEKFMIEQEVGLRLNNPKAAAMITASAGGGGDAVK
ncbi:hypothetical protein TacPo2_71 [Pantoea bacteriophage TacPo2]